MINQEFEVQEKNITFWLISGSVGVGSCGLEVTSVRSLSSVLCLEMDDSVTVHQRNLQLLMVEIYKTKYDPNPSFMKQIFEEQAMPYNLRCSDRLQLPKRKQPALKSIQ